jgi:hypothetical protein
MTSVVAYTWQSDVHSVEDTRAAYEFGTLQVNDGHPYAVEAGLLDGHKLPYNLQDHERNLIHPVFSTDEFDHGFN